MGWDVELMDDNGLVKVPRHSAGSIIAVDAKTGTEGQTDATMTVTYNYSELYYLVIEKSLPDFLDGKLAKDTISTLKKIVEKLGTDQYKRQKDGCTVEDCFKPENQIVDYWCPTMGNAGYVASILLDWAQLHPNAKWSVSK